MTSIVADLHQQLVLDTEQAILGFSPEVELTQQKMLLAKPGDPSVEQLLAEWFNRFQPCLFGRLAAKQNLIRYCVLNEQDLTQSDESICEKIQSARSLWTREGYEGKKSGFVILALSNKLANAAPDFTLRKLAERLCSLYLLEEQIEPDRIYTDEVFLEKPGAQHATWKWLAGVNVFSASADRRWWQDHRIPGGLAFSVNSVGHMVKSGVMSKIMQQLDELIGAPAEPLAVTKIDSLEKALEFAMRTIWGASNSISGKATELLPLPKDLETLPVAKCPTELPRFLLDRNYCKYQGYYHTDHTIPSDYFLHDVKRPDHVKPFSLDFTYLFRSHVNNPAYTTMGTGRRIRRAGSNATTHFLKYQKGEYEEISLKDAPRLQKALGS